MSFVQNCDPNQVAKKEPKLFSRQAQATPEKRYLGKQVGSLLEDKWGDLKLFQQEVFVVGLASGR